MNLEIHRPRVLAGASLQQVADYAGVTVAELTEWERTRSVPRKHAARVKWGLWAVQRDAALAASGLPECDRVPELGAAPEQADIDRLVTHVDRCETCLARSRYVEEHLPPAPSPVGGILVPMLRLAERLSGWQRAAATGAAMILMMGGAGVVFLAGVAVVKRDPMSLLMALGLLVVLVSSGAAGGIVYHLTEPMRRGGALGHYASATVTVYGYLAAALGLLALPLLLFGTEGADPESAQMLEAMAGPFGWITFAVTGLLFGIVLGRTLRH